ncbi:CASPE protein, partial [Amia calva]|nr:CASPE protein [Amia calva]
MGKKEAALKTDMPQLIISHYGLEDSVKAVQQIMQLIPRRDPDMIALLQPFVSKIQKAEAKWSALSSTAASATAHPAQGVGRGSSRLKPQKTVDCYNDEGFVYDINGRREAFILCQMSHRLSAQKNLQIITDLLEKRYNFNCQKKKKLSGERIILEIEKFRDGLSEGPEVKCCFVVLMAHRTMMEGEALIQGGNGKMVPLSEIFSLFNDENCPQLQGKPKVFIIQPSGGNNQDSGVMQTDDVAMKTEYKEDRPAKFRRPIISDTLTVYPALPGYKSLRDPKDGSPLFVNMERVFKQSDDRFHVLDLFTRVNQNLVQQDFPVQKTQPDGSTISQKVKIVLNMESTLTHALFLKRQL